MAVKVIVIVIAIAIAMAMAMEMAIAVAGAAAAAAAAVVVVAVVVVVVVVEVVVVVAAGVVVVVVPKNNPIVSDIYIQNGCKKKAHGAVVCFTCVLPEQRIDLTCRHQTKEHVPKDSPKKREDSDFIGCILLGMLKLKWLKSTTTWQLSLGLFFTVPWATSTLGGDRISSQTGALIKETPLGTPLARQQSWERRRWLMTETKP